MSATDPDDWTAAERARAGRAVAVMHGQDDCAQCGGKGCVDDERDNSPSCPVCCGTGSQMVARLHCAAVDAIDRELIAAQSLIAKMGGTLDTIDRELARMRPVIDAAIAWNNGTGTDAELRAAVDTFTDDEGPT